MAYRQISLHAFTQYVIGNIDKTDADGCWLWRGPGNDKGYGHSSYASPSGTHSAHRAAWEVMVGPIEPGLVLDHTCCNKLCVNPAHLEPVTPSENSKRGDRGRKRFGKAHSVRLEAARKRDAEERSENRAFSPAMQAWWDAMEFRALVHRLGPTSCGPALQRLCQLD